MLKYSKFLEDKSHELISESHIYYSPKLRDQLSGIDDDISKDLLSIEKTDVKPDITFIDSDKEGYLSFITMKNANKLIAAKYPTIEDFDKTGTITQANSIWDLDQQDDDMATSVYKKSRNIIKIGKLVNTLLSKKYSDKQIEEFVNKFKSYQENNRERISIVEGDDINYWYSSENYLRESGSLGSSCMRNKKGIFMIYTENPSVCRLLILTENGKLKGRALIWKVSDQKFEYFLDRQYTIIDSDVIKMRNYAVDQGWAYKTDNRYNSLTDITYNGVSEDLNMTVQVKDVDYEEYPYMDTFRIYDQNSGILYNEDDNDGHEGEYKLDDTDGGYTEIEYVNTDEVYSSYYEEWIPDDSALWSDPIQDYIWDNRSVEVTRVSNNRYRGYYPSDHDDIVFSQIDDAYYHYEDTTYSDYYEDYIYSDDVVNIVTTIEKDGDCSEEGAYLTDSDDGDLYISYSNINNSVWFEEVSNINPNWGNFEGIMKELLIENYNDEWIPEEFAINTYPVLDEENNVIENKYLTKVDAYILKSKILTDQKVIMDRYEYLDYIENVLVDLKAGCKKIIYKNQLELDLEDGNNDKLEARNKKISDRLEELEELY